MPESVLARLPFTLHNLEAAKLSYETSENIFASGIQSMSLGCDLLHALHDLHGDIFSVLTFKNSGERCGRRTGSCPHARRAARGMAAPGYPRSKQPGRPACQRRWPRNRRCGEQRRGRRCRHPALRASSPGIPDTNPPRGFRRCAARVPRAGVPTHSADFTSLKSAKPLASTGLSGNLGFHSDGYMLTSNKLKIRPCSSVGVLLR